MTIWWDLILKTEDIKGELERLYSSMSIRALADHLGVSKDALRKKLIKCKIQLRPRGGSYPKIPLEDLPKEAYNMNAAQLAALTGYSEQYCRKLRGRVRREHDKRQT